MLQEILETAIAFGAHLLAVGLMLLLAPSWPLVIALFYAFTFKELPREFEC